MFASTVHTLFAVPIGLAVLAMCLTPAQAATYSLADDFSYAENSADSTWSFRLDDGARSCSGISTVTPDTPQCQRNLGVEFSNPARDVE